MRLDTPTPWSADRFELGEGARWVDGRLVLVDLLAGRLLETSGDAPGALREVCRVPVPLGAVAPLAGRPGDWLAALGTGVATLTGDPTRTSDPTRTGAPAPTGDPAPTGAPAAAGTGTAAWEYLADLESANAAPARMNDAVADPHGRFWAGSMTYDGVPGGGTLYRRAPGGAQVAAVTGLTIANGPAFDAAGTVMYLADTPLGHVDRFAVDPGTGELSNREPFVRLSPDEGTPDGMTVDSSGHLWVALWGGHAVRRYRPDGALDREIRLPAAQPTSVCLGGPELRRLFVTTAHFGLEPPGPLDGALLAIDVDVAGLAARPAVLDESP
jgi:sugar lactone lactonase YvrE